MSAQILEERLAVVEAKIEALKQQKQDAGLVICRLPSKKSVNVNPGLWVSTAAH